MQFTISLRWRGGENPIRVVYMFTTLIIFNEIFTDFTIKKRPPFMIQQPKFLAQKKTLAPTIVNTMLPTQQLMVGDVVTFRSYARCLWWKWTNLTSALNLLVTLHKLMHP